MNNILIRKEEKKREGEKGMKWEEWRIKNNIKNSNFMKKLNKIISKINFQ